MATSLEEWFSGGERIAVHLPTRMKGKISEGRELKIFTRLGGEGAMLTFLHGFPSNSWDFAKIIPALETNYSSLSFDFLGFGDSDKPKGYPYSLLEQADLTEKLWDHFGVTHSSLVAHDYGSTVAIELLSRHLQGILSIHLSGVVLMNAGLYIDLQRPLLAQRLLQLPGVGAVISHLIGKSFFDRQFASIFSSAHPISTEDLEQYWKAITRREGLHNYHRLVYYLTERRMYKQRWENVLEVNSIPTLYIWGMEDPVSGAHISAEIRRRVPSANLVELPGIGHYPHLEVPQMVAADVYE